MASIGLVFFEEIVEALMVNIYAMFSISARSTICMTCKFRSHKMTAAGGLIIKAWMRPFHPTYSHVPVK